MLVYDHPHLGEIVPTGALARARRAHRRRLHRRPGGQLGRPEPPQLRVGRPPLGRSRSTPPATRAPTGPTCSSSSASACPRRGTTSGSSTAAAGRRACHVSLPLIAVDTLAAWLTLARERGRRALPGRASASSRATSASSTSRRSCASSRCRPRTRSTGTRSGCSSTWPSADDVVALPDPLQLLELQPPRLPREARAVPRRALGRARAARRRDRRRRHRHLGALAGSSRRPARTRPTSPRPRCSAASTPRPAGSRATAPRGSIRPSTSSRPASSATRSPGLDAGYLRPRYDGALVIQNEGGDLVWEFIQDGAGGDVERAARPPRRACTGGSLSGDCRARRRGPWAALELANGELAVALLPEQGLRHRRGRRPPQRDRRDDAHARGASGARPPPRRARSSAGSRPTPAAGRCCCRTAATRSTQHGVEWGFHGEAGIVPWRVDAHDGRRRAALDVADLGPARARARAARCAGRALELVERVRNAGDEADRGDVGPPPRVRRAADRAGRTIIDDRARTFIADSRAPGAGLEPGARSAWPHAALAAGGTLDLSVIPPPAEARAVLGYLSDFEHGTYTIANARLGPRGDAGVAARAVPERLVLAGAARRRRATPGSGACTRPRIEPNTTIPGQGIVRAREAGGVPLDARGRRDARGAARPDARRCLSGRARGGSGTLVPVGRFPCGAGRASLRAGISSALSDVRGGA